jgi:hypothetical protein
MACIKDVEVLIRERFSPYDVKLIKLGLLLGNLAEPDYILDWLRSDRIEALGGERPIDLMKTKEGLDKVLDVLSTLCEGGDF